MPIFPYRDDVPTLRSPLVTYALIAANAVTLFTMSQMPDDRREAFVYHHAFIPARVGQLLTGRPIEVEVPVEIEVPILGVIEIKKTLELEPVPGEIVGSWFASMFMHGNLMHLLSNMWFLWIFGDNVEDRLGRLPYLVFYLLGGMAAMACQWLHDAHSTVPVVGASGAVAAVLGAYVSTWPRARIRSLVFLVVFVFVVELPALVVLGGWFLLQLLEAARPQEFGLEGGVAWWAHIGGFLAGLILMPLLSTGQLDQEVAEYRLPQEW